MLSSHLASTFSPKGNNLCGQSSHQRQLSGLFSMVNRGCSQIRTSHFG